MPQSAPPHRHNPELVPALDGSADIASWVWAAARHRHITFEAGPGDTFATAASRLSDAEVRLDPVENLILAIERDGHVTALQAVLLHAAYLRQQR